MQNLYTSYELLSATQECDLAKQIEAGLLARDALADGGSPNGATVEELQQIVTTGEQAWQRFLLSNTRLVWAMARPQANKYGLEAAEIFQEGFVALVGALQRYDYQRGRFSTFAVPRIKQQIALATSSRLGAVNMPASTALRMRRAHGFAAEPEDHNLTADVPGQIAVQMLPQALIADPWHVLDNDHRILCKQVREHLEKLNGLERQVVTCRFGFGMEKPLTYSQLAQNLDTSASSVRRIEHCALEKLRSFL